MSELINTQDNRATIRWKLLTSASALALVAYVSTTAVVLGEDASRPQIWIELGGQLGRLEDGQEVFAPSVMDARPAIFAPSEKFEKPPAYGFDEFGSISFHPEDSSWVFSASVRYGHTRANKHLLQQTNPEPFAKYIPGLGTGATVPPFAQKFSQTDSHHAEKHSIIDFGVGKDVGLGLFGHGAANSTISAGVRFAQFKSGANIALKSDPDWHFVTKYVTLPPPFGRFAIPNGQPFHSNLANLNAERSFRGVGPSVSWKASMPIAGNTDNGAIAVDWGLNGAILFGRQKVRTRHQTTARYFAGHGQTAVPRTLPNFPVISDHTRSRNVSVPNVGGFAGISYNYSNAKLSLGYRADWFFNAIDGGIDAAKKEDRGFFGPYVSISVGLGD